MNAAILLLLCGQFATPGFAIGSRPITKSYEAGHLTQIGRNSTLAMSLLQLDVQENAAELAKLQRELEKYKQQLEAHVEPFDRMAKRAMADYIARFENVKPYKKLDYMISGYQRNIVKEIPPEFEIEHNEGVTTISTPRLRPRRQFGRLVICPTIPLESGMRLYVHCTFDTTNGRSTDGNRVIGLLDSESNGVALHFLSPNAPARISYKIYLEREGNTVNHVTFASYEVGEQKREMLFVHHLPPERIQNWDGDTDMFVAFEMRDRATLTLHEFSGDSLPPATD